MSVLALSPRAAEVARPAVRTRLTVTALAVLGGSLAIVGAASPWLSFFAGLQSITGLEGLNGRLAAGLGGATVAVGLLYLATGRAGLRWSLGLLGFGLLGLTGWSGIGLATTLGELQANPLLVVGVGPGVPLLAAGGALVFLTMFVSLPAADGARLSVPVPALRSPLAATLAIAGIVHLAVGPEHLAESVALGTAMIAAGVGQLVLAALVRRGGAASTGSPAWPLILAIALNVALVAAYVVAVTVGLPLVDVHGDIGTVGATGHEGLAHVDALTPLGLATVVLEVAGVACAVGIVAFGRLPQGR